MKKSFKNEVVKQGILLCIGLIIFVILITSWGFGFKEILEDGSSIFISIGIILYPIGITYGWRQILNFITGCTKTPEERLLDDYRYSSSTILNNGIIKWSIIFAITVCFGWILGVFNAIKILIKATKNQSI